MRSFFFIPVWNQINQLPNLLAELQEKPLACTELLIINNGSNDGSQDLIHKSGFRFIDIPENRGIGYSFIVAIELALKENFDIFGVLAGNGKMIPSEMNRVISPILKREADYVTGSRFLPGGSSPHLPAFRQSAIPLVNVFVRLLYGANLTDATCGYKAMRLDLFKNAEFNWKDPWLYGYGFEYYLYGKILLSKRYKWKEVPITMRYPPTNKSYSKIRPFTGWYDMLRPWWRARFDGKTFTI